MTPEELDLAIINLLEEQPNQEKPVRRRRNKFKDLVKRARRNQPIITDKMVEDIAVNDRGREITHVRIRYTQDDIYMGEFEGWYDNINQIALELDEPSHALRLERVGTYDYELDRHFYTGTARVYRKAYRIETTYYDKHNQVVTTRGKHNTNNLVINRVLKEGVYEYDNKMQELMREYYGWRVPSKVVKNLYDTRDVKYDADKFMRFDKDNKYPMHARAMREYDTNNFYSGTIPIQKGDIRGTHNTLINTLNNTKDLHKYIKDEYDVWDELTSKSLPEYVYIDRAVQDYEDAVHDMYYEYIW